MSVFIHDGKAQGEIFFLFEFYEDSIFGHGNLAAVNNEFLMNPDR